MATSAFYGGEFFSGPSALHKLKFISSKAKGSYKAQLDTKLLKPFWTPKGSTVRQQAEAEESLSNKIESWLYPYARLKS